MKNPREWFPRHQNNLTCPPTWSKTFFESSPGYFFHHVYFEAFSQGCYFVTTNVPTISEQNVSHPSWSCLWKSYGIHGRRMAWAIFNLKFLLFLSLWVGRCLSECDIHAQMRLPNEGESHVIVFVREELIFKEDTYWEYNYHPKFSKIPARCAYFVHSYTLSIPYHLCHLNEHLPQPAAQQIQVSKTSLCLLCTCAANFSEDPKRLPQPLLLQ